MFCVGRSEKKSCFSLSIKVKSQDATFMLYHVFVNRKKMNYFPFVPICIMYIIFLYYIYINM